MIKAKTDIDIDTGDRDKLLSLFKHNRASMKDNDSFKKHNTGVYFTDIPMNPIDNLSSVDYEEAEDRGYIKVDILNVSLYKDIKNEEHLTQLLKKVNHQLVAVIVRILSLFVQPLHEHKQPRVLS